MDNLTHSLCGALVAELWLQCAPARLRADDTAPAQRRLIYIASIVANNLPDSDLLLTLVVQGKLGYLLHHRGHTHTVVGALALAVVLMAPLVWLLQRSERRAAPKQRSWFGPALLGPACVSLLGVLLHLLLDFGNNYGVHPFWPIDNRWFYGDAVFIIEPWWWSVAGAGLAAAAHTRTARFGLAFVWLIGTFAAWLLPLPHASRLYATALGLGAGLVLGVPWTRLRLTAAQRIVACAGLICSLYAVQLGLRARALGFLDAQLVASEAAGTASAPLQVLDRISTPMPVTPWCWDVLVVATQGSQYVMKIARISALPSVFAAAQCPVSRPSPSAPLHALPNALPLPSAVLWDGEYRIEGRDWAQISRDCTMQAFQRYSRAPFVTAPDAARPRVLGDLRYDRVPEIEFAEIELPEPGAACPTLVPNWLPPRQDVLEALRHTP